MIRFRSPFTFGRTQNRRTLASPPVVNPGKGLLLLFRRLHFGCVERVLERDEILAGLE